MAFIKVQKLIRNEDGAVVSGSASLVDVFYVKDGAYHSRQQIRECLGQVIHLNSAGKTGIFMSPTRGLVGYDAATDTFCAIEKDDSRIRGLNVFSMMDVHTVFGDSYLILKFLEKSRLIGILRGVFPKKQDYERILCHIIHGVMRDGSKISCDNYIAKSFASYVLADIPLSTLRTDTAFFRLMGKDSTRMSFFAAFIKTMRAKSPGFGKGCYVDSTPLPNDIVDNPFNALCSHGVSSASVQTRLVLVLDEDTGLPVWYDIIPGNVLDISTLMTVINDVAVSLDIEIHSLVLDAGYVSKELVRAFHIGTEKTFIGRMPARKGFPFKELYWDVKNLIGKGKYAFVRKRHTYFGKRKEIELFGHKEYAYVYVDQNNALQRFRDYLLSHGDEYEALKDKEKDWLTVKNGFFVLLSNRCKTPAELLSDYFERMDIESAFKTSKEYLGLLPLSKWTIETVRGKILHDIINTIVLLLLRKEIDESGISTSELSGKIQSLMCFRSRSGLITVETPNRQTKDYFGLLAIPIPSSVNVDEFRSKVLGLN
jgi:hypothetical protein